jgi:hypothetical protein
MSNLQVHNSFEPYYAGRNSEDAKWTVRKKTKERAKRSGIDPTDTKPEQPDAETDQQARS